MFKRKEVVMLPTDKKAIMAKRNNKLYSLPFSQKTPPLIKELEGQHLHILSNEKLNIDDYVYNTRTKRVELVRHKIDTCEEVFCKKIIATTDDGLRINSTIRDTSDDNYGKVLYILPRISKSFVDYFTEEYNKANLIKEVMVEYETFEEISWDELKTSKDNMITIKNSQTKEELAIDEILNLVGYVDDPIEEIRKLLKKLEN